MCAYFYKLKRIVQYCNTTSDAFNQLISTISTLLNELFFLTNVNSLTEKLYTECNDYLKPIVFFRRSLNVGSKIQTQLGLRKETV